MGPAILFVPASNARALARAPSLGADALIYDLEDAVVPAERADARERLRDAVRRERPARFAIRINPPGDANFTEDLLLARALRPNAIVVPKVDDPAVLDTVEAALAETDAPDTLRLWAMIETPRGVLNVAAIAARGGRLDALVAGTNDLGAATGTEREHMRPWLGQIVLAARANGVRCFDGVRNDIEDADELVREAREGAAMGFDGKTLIHPSQIAPVQDAFRPDADAVAHARAVVDAFAAEPDAAVLVVGGRMVERMHLAAARRTLARLGDDA